MSALHCCFRAVQLSYDPFTTKLTLLSVAKGDQVGSASTVARQSPMSPLQSSSAFHMKKLLKALLSAAGTLWTSYLLCTVMALYHVLQGLAHDAFPLNGCWFFCRGTRSKQRLIVKGVGCPTYHCLRFLCLLFLCTSLLLAQQATATLVASSKISYCSDAGDRALNCTKKMMVSLTVEAVQQAGEESFVLLKSALDETVSAGTSSNKTVNFSPISITTSRSAVRYRYPIFYVQNYNAKPYEATVKGKMLNQCNAELDADKATCGVALDPTRKAIPFSQGFCCDCSMCQTLGFCEPNARANMACNVFDAYTTASCLRFGPRWYSGYTIGAYVTWFTLNVTVSRNVTDSTAPEGSGVAQRTVQQTAVLQLSPSVLDDAAEGAWGVSARLIGSFSPTNQPLDLTSHMLFAPVLPLKDERVQAGAAEWMLLPSRLVTLDGTECNKVGVSYEAFASQGNKCNLIPGSCLSSQLEDYRTSDLARVAEGKKAQYMATGYGNFDVEQLENTNVGLDGALSPYISYTAVSSSAAMIVLTVSADDLEYIVGMANGRILSAALNSATLEVNTRDGVLSVVVQNVATVTGRLVVSVQGCSGGVLPMAAQVVSLAAQQQSNVSFNVYMLSSTASGKASCTVIVRNAEASITDSRVINWMVTDTVFSNGTQGGNGGGHNGSSSEEFSATTCTACGTLNILCAYRRNCHWLFLLDLLIYLIIVAAFFGVLWFRHIFCCCFYAELSSGPRVSEGDRRIHSPSRGENRGACEAGRFSRPREARGHVSSRGVSPRHHHQHHVQDNSANNINLSGHHLRGAVVMPHPPLMTYTSVPAYRGGAPYAATTSPFSSPLRVLPPPSLSPSRALTPALVPPHAYRDVNTSDRHAYPPAFLPELPDEFAAHSAIPSFSPEVSHGANGWEEFHSLAPMPPPLMESLPVRRARSELELAWQNAPQWRSYRGGDNATLALDLSRPSTPSPTLPGGGRAPN
ncbi:hypothetical protein ABL78_7160 [Leptomonas seymouri]|uniref:Generative cell specific-1/HAP2 domain-containing protein n=1 Tax=Leptomonas seymouri TaxID=5684 RepID=A0A0N0P372_LEPSE|nr:hypothetical protein ABL78_7160 [Leptomonas seymouri]|eukprot:KPI83796.1 hypothetical protein ABL78_7160 [Leptomonas seymouri]